MDVAATVGRDALRWMRIKDPHALQHHTTGMLCCNIDRHSSCGWRITSEEEGAGGGGEERSVA